MLLKMFLLDLFHFGEVYYLDGEISTIDWPKWISSLCSVFTLILAYKIYKSFDVSKKSKEKQLNTVFDLVKEMQTSFVLFDSSKNALMSSQFHFNQFEKLLEVDYYKAAFESQDVKFDDELFLMPYTEYSNNPFLPITIAKELKPLSNWSYNFKNEKGKLIDENNHYLLYIYSEEEGHFNSLKSQTHVNPSLAFKNIYEYINQVLKLYAAINKWLKDHGVTDLNI